MSQGYLKYLDDGPPVVVPCTAGDTIVPGDPVERDAAGTVSVSDANDTVIYGWSTADGTAAAATRIGVIPASDRVHWVLPIATTDAGGEDTAAIQTANGATLGAPGVRAVGATYLAVIGAFRALKGSTGSWSVALDLAGADLLQIVDYIYNEARGVYDAEVVVVSAARQHGVSEL